jgi:hypothetical protein
MRKILLALMVGIFTLSAFACSEGGHGVKEKEKEQQEEERSL